MDSDSISDSIKVNPNTINCCVIMFLVGLYISWRSIFSKTSLLSIIRGKFRSIAGIVFISTVYASICYNVSLYILSFQYNIDKVVLELTHKFVGKYKLSFNDYTIDLGTLMPISLKISETLLISCLFMAITLLGTSESNYIDPMKGFRRALIIFSNLWAVLRLPLNFYGYYLELIINDQLYLFIRLLAGNIEFVFITLLIGIFRFKNSSVKNINIEPTFLAFSCFGYGFLKYSLNLIDFPFKLTKNMLETVLSIQFGLQAAIYLLLAEILYPKKEKQQPVNAFEISKPFPEEVTMLESVIIFDDKKLLN